MRTIGIRQYAGYCPPGLAHQRQMRQPFSGVEKDARTVPQRTGQRRWLVQIIQVVVGELFY